VFSSYDLLRERRSFGTVEFRSKEPRNKIVASGLLKSGEELTPRVELPAASLGFDPHWRAGFW